MEENTILSKDEVFKNRLERMLEKMNEFKLKYPLCIMELEVKRKQEKLDAFARLLSVMEDLRAGCPWDQKQTWESLRHLTIEEVYELGDAILDSDHEEVKKEIGDIFCIWFFTPKSERRRGILMSPTSCIRYAKN